MDARNTSDLLLSFVKNSNLNFSIKESPFSVQISIRKTFIKLNNGSQDVDSLESFLASKTIDDNDSLRDALTNLESENQALTTANHQLSNKLEKAKHELADTLKDSNEMQKDLLKIKSENKSLKCEVQAALKDIETEKSEKDNLKVKNEVLSENLRSLLKEKKDLIKDNQKNLKQLELLNFKKTLSSDASTSTSSANTPRTKSTNTNNSSDISTTSTNSNHFFSTQSNSNPPIEAILRKDINRNILEPLTKQLSFSSCKCSSSEDSPTLSKSSQTDQNQDIPYSITSPLPPIFSSQLFHHSKRIHFLSNSLPNLSTITWVRVTEEDEIRDEAEQALCDQYDRQVRAYYDDAQDKAEVVRQVYDENLIGRLFKEND